MKKVAVFVLLLFLSLFAVSQVNIIKSTTLNTENGITYYIHNVEAGQTVYSITKAYGITEEELLKSNPALAEGLKTGMTLKIVKKDEIVTDMAGPKSPQPIEIKGDEPKVHEVAAGETLYKIMNTYGTSLEKLMMFNPELTANLKVGQKIVIPTESMIAEKMLEKKYGKFSTYTVKKRDTYSKLKKNLGFNQEILEELNPELKQKGLIEGMVIKIPAQVDMGVAPVETNMERAVSVVEKPIEKEVEKPVVINTNSGCGNSESKKTTYKIGIMMPFNTQFSNEINTDNQFVMKPADQYKSFKFIQYYEGFLLALDSMKKAGFEAEVYVYDTKADSATTLNLMKKPEFKELDLIIGPFFARNLKSIVPEAAKNHTFVVSPFSSGAGVGNYSNLFVIETSENNLWAHGFKYLNDSLKGANIFIIHNGTPSQIETVNYLKKLHSTKGSDSTLIRVFNYKDGGTKTLYEQLSPTKTNVLINLSTNEAYISNFVRQLNQNREKYPIVLMGLEEQWKKFKTLEEEYLVNLRLTLLSNSFIDYRQPYVQDFVKKFQTEYNIDPQLIAFKGYDHGLYFMQLLQNYGTDFPKCIGKHNYTSVQNQFSFKIDASGKWVNTNGSVYQYFNYELVDKKIPYISPEMLEIMMKIDSLDPIE